MLCGMNEVKGKQQKKIFFQSTFPGTHKSMNRIIFFPGIAFFRTPIKRKKPTPVWLSFFLSPIFEVYFHSFWEPVNINTCLKRSRTLNNEHHMFQMKNNPWKYCDICHASPHMSQLNQFLPFGSLSIIRMHFLPNANHMA